MATGINALDSKVGIGMFLNSMKGRFKIFLASTMTAEEKLAAITKEMEKDVQEKRVLARQIGAQMRAIADPETKELEPLEAMKVRRGKLVTLGGQLLDNPEKKSQLGQIQQEIKMLDSQITSQQSTYDMLDGSYEKAKKTYQKALQGVETVKQNGPAMLKAIQVNKDALAMRDKADNQDTIDTSFLNELAGELSNSEAELRSDGAIDADLDATNGSASIDTELAKMDAETVDDGLMAEFKAAAASKK